MLKILLNYVIRIFLISEDSNRIVKDNIECRCEPINMEKIGRVLKIYNKFLGFHVRLRLTN